LVPTPYPFKNYLRPPKNLIEKLTIHLGNTERRPNPLSDPTLSGAFSTADSVLLALFSLSIIALATRRRWTLPVAVFGIFAVKYTLKVSRTHEEKY
jgi:hypothetical protein